MRSYEESAVIDAPREEVFAYVDNHHNFASHMNQSSWMMGGAKMITEIDEGKGMRVGSHIKMSGIILGIKIYLDEVISERIVPRRKVWETVGTPKLLVIGKYVLGFEIKPKGNGSDLRVFLQYALPTGPTRILGILFGEMYARWCVQQVTWGIQDHFNTQ